MSKKVCKMKQGLLLLGCLVAAVGCKQAPPTQMETGYEVIAESVSGSLRCQCGYDP